MWERIGAIIVSTNTNILPSVLFTNVHHVINHVINRGTFTIIGMIRWGLNKSGIKDCHYNCINFHVDNFLENFIWNISSSIGSCSSAFKWFYIIPTFTILEKGTPGNILKPNRVAEKDRSCRNVQCILNIYYLKFNWYRRSHIRGSYLALFAQRHAKDRQAFPFYSFPWDKVYLKSQIVEIITLSCLFRNQKVPFQILHCQIEWPML